ncbi:restriction endonuclease [Chloroflexota bacterium]
MRGTYHRRHSRLSKIGSPRDTYTAPVNPTVLAELKELLLGMSHLEPHQRGFTFQTFLTQLFDVYGLAARGSFRLIGEQIDGSFEINSDTYLLEAKWHTEQIPQSDLLIFREKVENKSTWARGMFISYSDFTEDGGKAFARGRATNIIGMTGQDLFFVLDGEISLIEAILRKARRAAETGEFFVSVLTCCEGRN